jgi:hypothetical protein
LIERAFELARSGQCASVSVIGEQLRREGFSWADISQNIGGKGTKAQLAKAAAEAKLASVKGSIEA